MYGVRDLYDMLEILAVDAYNRNMVARRQRERADLGL